MRRRNLLISIGALGTGAAAAFGTEAFTSIEAERSVDVAVAGDANAYLAIQPLNTDNADAYVSTEGDGTVALDLDGDGSADGGGVSQDAVTQVEDLFKIVNQGTQPTSVYFEDDSDAVTFRVTRSTNTSTNGTHGESLEGADNSVELDVGEQVVVGLTIDTLNYDVSGSLVDDVTVVADAGASAPQQSVPQPQYVVDGSGSEPNTFATLTGALTSGEIEQGAVVGVKGGQTIDESGGNVDIATPDVTVTGFDGRPTIQTGGNRIKATANGVTVRNLVVTSNSGSDTFRTLEAVGDSVTFDGVSLSASGSNGNPLVQINGADATVTNCDVTGAPVAVSGASGSVTLTGNFVKRVPTEGIFGFNNSSLDTITVRKNLVENHDTGGNGSKEIKFQTSPAPSINAQSTTDDKLNSIITENDVNTAQVESNLGVTVDSDASAGSNLFGEIDAGIQDVGTDGYVLVRDGTYTSAQITVDSAGVTVEPADTATPTLDASDVNSGFDIKSDGVTIRGLTIDSTGVGVSSGEVEGIFIGDPTGFTDRSETITIEDVSITNVDGTTNSTEGIHVKSYDAGDPIDGVEITNVTIDGVTSSGAGANGVKLQADANNVDIVDTTIRNATGDWAYGVVLTPSSNETGIPKKVSFEGTTIETLAANVYDSVGIGIDSNSGGAEGSSGEVADPAELSFVDTPETLVRKVDIGVQNKNTNKTFTAPTGLTFGSVGTEVENL